MSLTELPAAHEKALRDGLPVFNKYGLLLAGGYAFRAHDLVDRPSRDLDFATSSSVPLREIAEAVANHYVSLGYQARMCPGTPRLERLILTVPGEDGEFDLDLLKEALRPEPHAADLRPGQYVYTVTLEDAVGLKVRAVQDRSVARDIVDLYSLREMFSFEELERLGAQHEPSFDWERLHDHLLAAVAVFLDEEFEFYGLDQETMDELRAWATRWSDDLGQRRGGDYDHDHADSQM